MDPTQRIRYEEDAPAAEPMRPSRRSKPTREDIKVRRRQQRAQQAAQVRTATVTVIALRCQACGCQGYGVEGASRCPVCASLAVESAYGEGAQQYVIPLDKFPHVPNEKYRQDPMDEFWRSVGIPPERSQPVNPGGFDEPFQKERFHEREKWRQNQERREQMPDIEKDSPGYGGWTADDIVKRLGPPSTERRVSDAEELRKRDMTRDESKMDFFRQKWQKTNEPIGLTEQGIQNSRRNTRNRWKKVMGPTACEHNNCPPWECKLDKHASRTAGWESYHEDFGCPNCGSNQDLVMTGDPRTVYCERCGEDFDGTKSRGQLIRERSAFDAVGPTQELRPLRQSQNSRTATVLTTQIERANPGDMLRTPQGQTVKIKKVRPHETEGDKLYVDTDQGTSVMSRGTDVDLVPYNAQQRELPGSGIPGANTGMMPGAGSGAGGEATQRQAPTCPVDGAKMVFRNQMWICPVDGTAAPTAAAPAGMMPSDWDRGHLLNRPADRPVPQTHLWASRYNTIDRPPLVVLESQRVLSTMEENR